MAFRPPAREGISPRKVMLTGIVPATPTYWAGEAGDSAFSPGTRLEPGTVLPGPTLAWYHPSVPSEEPILFDYRVVFEDGDLIVADKPHFLPTTSNGRIVRETLQTRLRVDLNEDSIVPLHRLDRLTSGLVLCSRNPRTRAAYQQLFQKRVVVKHYRAQVAAPFSFDGTVRLGMRRVRGERQVRVDSTGTPTVTRVRASGTTADVWPLTGHTHQIRVVLNHLGHPIVGDDTYPVDRGLDLYDFSTPLLLSHVALSFSDPVTGRKREFQL
ncbi:pseudouridine synthase [Corynebacterium aurimucosum]|uniref:RNA pseudouridylate synthase n=1 Tax=Corynebacterium aurimucosum (strain ATCC 700975 / DSM 44827 / CIP 107346 / CN-1) TaxID=548476 RepID=C3PFH5_CORA7|nr:pseudouridine synthase [Corynebacterium aurimucosum]ACP32579.1 putative pseudouridylate synthase [Corynebacterium aurimucosum ATCC 700975]QQU93246.1 pseudouridine synthase [Corynebacterium aurimucosum]